MVKGSELSDKEAWLLISGYEWDDKGAWLLISVYGWDDKGAWLLICVYDWDDKGAWLLISVYGWDDKRAWLVGENGMKTWQGGRIWMGWHHDNQQTWLTDMGWKQCIIIGTWKDDNRTVIEMDTRIKNYKKLKKYRKERNDK